MIKFLVIAQDLRISGTSEGIVSRSFLAKLRKTFPKAVIDVLYLKTSNGNDDLHLLPIDSIETHVLNLKVPIYTKWFNKLYWRIWHASLNECYIQKVYASCISKVDYKKYNHIFIRSSGLEYEAVLAAKNLPILKDAIVNFHDPYPLFWYSTEKNLLSKLELFRLKAMAEVVAKARKCMTPSGLLSQDLQFLYSSDKKFVTIPHQFDTSVFDLSDTSQVIKRSKKVTISYHGAIMFGRNIDILLDAYTEIIESNIELKENTEFVLRLRGQDNKRLREKYFNNKNILVLDTLNFSNSCYEQTHEADILVILENGPVNSNVLVGKAPFLASLNKSILCVSPEQSEMRRLVEDEKYIASNTNKEEIKLKLKNLIDDRLSSNAPVYPFGDYFSEENFKLMLKKVLEGKYD